MRQSGRCVCSPRPATGDANAESIASKSLAPAGDLFSAGLHEWDPTLVDRPRASSEASRGYSLIEAFGVAIGLRPVGAGVLLLDAQRGAGCGKVLGPEGLKAEPLSVDQALDLRLQPHVVRHRILQEADAFACHAVVGGARRTLASCCRRAAVRQALMLMAHHRRRRRIEVAELGQARTGERATGRGP